VQGDTGRIFRFILEDITMDGSEQARVYAKKPDGTEVYNDCEVVSPNEVLMESDSGQIFAAIGVVQAEIQISKSGKTITTYTFEFDVEISITRAGAIQSSSEYGALEAAIAKAEGFYNPTFAEAKTRDNINSGESIPTLFGKVKKWFTDLNTLIKLVGSTDISGIGNGTVTDALSVLNSKQSKTISVSNVTSIQELVNSATGGTNILFHLAGAGYTGSDLPKDTNYGYGSGIIFYRNSRSCKIVLFPEGAKPVWKTSDWTKWRDFANNIVD
jgi:hypothetical protein